METRLLGTKAGLLQRNLNEGYTFSADIFQELNGAQVNIHVNTPTTPALSAMHHFADAILRNVAHDAGAEQGLVVMEILDAIYESARTGKPVQIAKA
jgi:predicted dehydrogenase